MRDLIQRPELLSALLGGLLDGLSIVDTSGRHVYVNDALCRMLGFSRDELLGVAPPYPYWPPEERVSIEAAFQRTLDGESTNFELVFGRKDGSRVEVIVAPATLRDDSGKSLAYFATIKDISERKRLERSQLESEQRWRSIAENPFDFVILIDREYRYTYVNHTAPGITREQLIGRATPFDYVDPKHHDDMRAAFETAFSTGRATSYDVHVPQLDAWYSSIVGPVFEQGKVTSLSILTREITEQKRAEEALRRSEHRLREAHRMETIGTLAGGIAHDINNMLTPILAYAELARMELPSQHDVQEHLRGIAVASARARDLVHRILLFSRKQEPRKSVFDLGESVREDLTLLRASLPSNIELVTLLPEQPIHVLADRAQLGQVLTNLATNAMQAMSPGGGTLTITLEPGTTDAPQAVLCVTDTGCGMDAETQRRAFDPFFTTKHVGAGTGLGLSIVHSVVREHGGEISLRSARDEGASITIRLPTTTSGAYGASDEGPSTLPPLPVQLRVLVVDDEPEILRVTQRALTRSGCKVTVAASATEALDIFVRDPQAFDLLLTDQSMPRMNGTALITEVRTKRPTMPCLLMTGHGDDATHRSARALDVREVIAKPFSMTTLLVAVQRAGAARPR